MELGDVMLMMDWSWHRVLFAALLGAGTTGCIRLITVNPWVGVFVTACTTMWYLGEASELEWENQARKAEVAELEKQVVALRSALHEMSLANSELEAVNHRMGGWRRSISRDCSTRSL